MPLLTLSDMRGALPAAKALSDDDLSRYRLRVEVAVARYLGVWHDAASTPTLDSGAYTVYLDGPMDEHHARLDLWSALGLPVSAVSAVAEDDVGDRTYSYSVSSDDYELVDGRTLELVPSGGHSWARGRRVIQVTCTAGYSTTAPPEDLVDALLLTWRAMWQERAGRSGQSSNPRADALGVQVRIPPAARDLLDGRRCLAGVAG